MTSSGLARPGERLYICEPVKRGLTMLYGLLLVIHVLVSLLLVVVVLMQSSKGRGLAGIAGGAASSAVFGGRQAAGLLHKVTIGLALVFGINLLFLGVLSRGRSTPHSVTQEQGQETEPTPLDFLGGDQSAVPATGTETGTDTPAPTDQPAPTPAR
jgi:preprotein translocase subunit SecG